MVTDGSIHYSRGARGSRLPRRNHLRVTDGSIHYSEGRRTPAGAGGRAGADMLAVNTSVGMEIPVQARMSSESQSFVT